MHLFSRLDQRPAIELGARKPTRRRAERGNSAAYNIRLAGAFNLYQYGLTSSQPHGGVKVASRSVVRTVALNLVGFPSMRHMVIRDLTFATGRWLPVVATMGGRHIGKKGLASPCVKRRGSEWAAITHWTCDSWPHHLLYQ